MLSWNLYIRYILLLFIIFQWEQVFIWNKNGATKDFSRRSEVIDEEFFYLWALQNIKFGTEYHSLASPAFNKFKLKTINTPKKTSSIVYIFALQNKTFVRLYNPVITYIIARTKSALQRQETAPGMPNCLFYCLYLKVFDLPPMA